MKKLLPLLKNYLITSTVWAILWSFFATPNFNDSNLFTSLLAALCMGIAIIIIPTIIYLILHRIDGDDVRASKLFKTAFKVIFFLALLILFGSIQTNFLSGTYYFLPIMAIISFYILKKF
tara:strand:- start:173 stop:532 length:360 start_codon:yes stop_codon:yes gene_type:complete